MYDALVKMFIFIHQSQNISRLTEDKESMEDQLRCIQLLQLPITMAVSYTVQLVHIRSTGSTAAVVSSVLSDGPVSLPVFCAFLLVK